MFALAILVGLYSYIIFTIGIIGLLYKQVIIDITVFYIVIILFIYRFTIKNHILTIINLTRSCNSDWLIKIIFKKKLLLICIIIIMILIFINLIGVLGPEYAFDALWYHLTIPKIYLHYHKVFFIPGELFYYSAMPKLIEMLYLSALAIKTEILAKIIHFSFGLLTTVGLYKFSRMYFSRKLALVVCLIFYSNIVVAWESTTAYIDLGRMFFEVLALWSFMCWFSRDGKKMFILSAVMLGFAIATKLLAFASLPGFILLIFLKKKESHKESFLYIVTYIIISCFIVSPWLILAYFYTGNPVYPFFSHIYKTDISITSLLSPVKFIKDTFSILAFSDDPISPLYIIVLPLLIIYFYKFRPAIKIITLYAFMSLLGWYITPRTGGGRFILPYLPVFSLIIGEVYSIVSKKYRFVIVSTVIAVACISLVYRGIAVAKSIPFIFGKESKIQYLTGHLNFSYGDFYDIDEYFKKNINNNDKVLLYGFHNLYYVEFPYIESSVAKKGEKFNYIATQHTGLPLRFADWRIIYKNDKTGVVVYTKNKDFFAY